MPSSERLRRQLFELSLVTLITVIIWIGYGVYSALTNPVNTSVSTAELRPLPPLLSKEQFEPLRSSLRLDENQLSNFPISSGLSVAPATSQTSATPSAEVSASPSAAPGGSPSDLLRELLF